MACHEIVHVQCGYVTITNSTGSINAHNRYPIARPWGQAMGCLLWVSCLFNVISLLLSRCMQCGVILGRVIIKSVITRNRPPSVLGQTHLPAGTKSHQTQSIIYEWLYGSYPQTPEVGLRFAAWLGPARTWRGVDKMSSQGSHILINIYSQWNLIF